MSVAKIRGRPETAALYTVNITQESVEATFVVHPTNSQSMFLGKVVDEQGVGIANLQIQATWNGPTNTTDANGNFEFLAPTGSTYPRLIDTNYLISSTPAAPAPDHPAERIITARRVTSALSLRLTFPEGFAQPGSVGARASTRIGGSSYYVNGDSGTNQIIRLPVFPGSWKVFANVPGVLVARPPVIEVGSGSEGVEVAVDLKPLPIASGSVRGRVVAPSGSPLKFFSVQALGDWFLGDSFPVVGATDEDGRFSRKANGKCDIIIYNGPMTASVAANVQDALETDLGTIQMPDCKVKAVVTFVDETGTPIKFSGYYWNWLRASCERAGAKFVVTNNGMDNPRSVLLTPGVWQIEAETEDEGYAIAAPLMLEVGQTDMRTNILLRRLQSPRAAPSINISAGADGLTLRAASASAKYVDIEASSDLKVWRYYSTQPMIGSQIDSTTPVSGGSPSLYFRAANADLPAAE